MRDYLNARAMASWESSWLEPPCPEPAWVECAHCGREILEDDALWEDDIPYCSDECFDNYWDD